MLAKYRQSGVSLVLVISLLAAGSLLGLSAMQSSRVEEAISGNQRAILNAKMAADYGAVSVISGIGAFSHGDCATQEVAYGNPLSAGNQQAGSQYKFWTCEESGGGVLQIHVVGMAGGVERGLYVEYSLPEGLLNLAAQNFPGGILFDDDFVAANSDRFVVEGVIEDTVSGSPGVPAVSTNGQKEEFEDAVNANNYVGEITDSIDAPYLSDPNVFMMIVDHLKAESKTGINDYVVGTVNNQNRVDLEGPNGEPIITYINGDYDPGGNWSGKGVLVVDGDYLAGGTPQFDGLVIVLGDVFSMNGGGNGGVDGSVIVAPTQLVLDENGDPIPVLDGDENPLTYADGSTVYQLEYATATITSKTRGGGAASYSHSPPNLSAAYDIFPQEAKDIIQSSLVESGVTGGGDIIAWREVYD